MNGRSDHEGVITPSIRGEVSYGTSSGDDQFGMLVSIGFGIINELLTGEVQNIYYLLDSVSRMFGDVNGG